jgi:tripartite-type tricarboxylate transporter receptor subunit TctC
MFAVCAHTAAAPSYPTRPLRMIATFPPGGGADFAARTVAQKLTGLLGEQVVVDNRPGADGSIGVQVVARATPDGYTLALANNGPLAINVSLPNSNLPYDPLKDLTYVSLVVSYPFIIAARPSLPVKSVRELIELAKANPGKLNFGSSGSISRLGQVLFKSMGGVEMNDVPYNGNGPTVIAVIGGHIDLMLASPTLAQLKTGALRGIAVTGTRRSVVLPDVPTVAESGIPGYDVTAWAGIIAPAGLPPSLVAKINAEVLKVLKMPDTRDRLEIAGLEVVGSSPAAFAEVVRAEIRKWARVTPLMKN